MLMKDLNQLKLLNAKNFMALQTINYLSMVCFNLKINRVIMLF